jgi:hypothetical protein
MLPKEEYRSSFSRCSFEVGTAAPEVGGMTEAAAESAALEAGRIKITAAPEIGEIAGASATEKEVKSAAVGT